MIQRFNVVERLTHWMTATAFIVLAITGLNYVFGKRLLMPLIGADAFSAWSQWSKLAHASISWVLMAGVLIMLVVWIKDNLPDRSEEHTSELQSLMRISYAVFCLKKKNT